MTKTTQKITDILAKRFFYFYDIIFTEDAEVIADSDHADGYVMPTDEIRACHILFYSYDSKNYIAKLTKYRAFPTQPDYLLESEVADCHYGRASTIEKHRLILDALPREQLKIRALFEANVPVFDDDGNPITSEAAYFEYGSEEIEGYDLEELETLHCEVGGANEIMEFVTKMQKAHKPWKLIAKLEESAIKTEKTEGEKKLESNKDASVNK